MQFRLQEPAAPRRIFLAVLAGALAALLLLKTDLRSIVDDFHEQRSESKILAVYRASAADVSYADCRKDSALCLGKTVAWPVWHIAKGVSYIDEPSQSVIWSNEEQVPINQARSGPTSTIAEVRAVHPESIELVFLGSPQAAYGGTTKKEKR